MEQNFNFLLAGTVTHAGRIRKSNEDSMTAFETANMKVFVVCDGMGGHAGGQIASQTAITAIRDFLNNNISIDPREAIYNSITEANRAVLNRSRQQPELAGMGSTCAMLAVTSGGKVYYGHVGDSRIYIIASHRIRQLTEDHSEVWELYKAGVIKTREEMERHPRKNVITNALGLPDMKPPTICSVPIEPESGNCFLLCSDGLTCMVDDEQIQRVVSKHDIPIRQRAERLVEIANANGGVDNITVALVEFAVGTQQINSPVNPKKNWRKALLYILLPVLLLAGGGMAAWWMLSKRPIPDETVEKGLSSGSTTETPEQDENTDDNEKNIVLPPNPIIEKERPSAPPPPKEVTFCDTVPIVCSDDSPAVVILSACKELEKISWVTGGKMETSLLSSIQAEIAEEKGEFIMRVTWLTGRPFPKDGVVIIYCKSKQGTDYHLTIHLKEITEEEPELAKEADEDLDGILATINSITFP